MPFCQKCGKEYEEGARNCPSCGTALDRTGDVRRVVSRDREEQMCFGLSGGALPGLVIGAIIIIVGVTSVFGGNFGEMMGSWGESFGEGMGRWGEGVGRFFADWGNGWGGKIGASFSIIVGLAILYYFVYGRGKR